jgi:hypothetical protein
MRRIGFSTGAVARGDFKTALNRLDQSDVRVVELSALRLEELLPFVRALTSLDLRHFEFVSFHAPSRFSPEDETHVLEQLRRVAERSIPVIVHPNVIFTPELWAWLGSLLLIENMDKRMPVGQTAKDLGLLFDMFPSAKLCCDLGHARQVDPTMTEARMILERFQDRIAEIHISDVNTSSRHDPLSTYAMAALRSVSALIPEPTPIILESLIDEGQSDIPTEIARARDALEPAFQALPQ